MPVGGLLPAMPKGFVRILKVLSFWAIAVAFGCGVCHGETSSTPVVPGAAPALALALAKAGVGGYTYTWIFQVCVFLIFY